MNPVDSNQPQPMPSNNPVPDAQKIPQTPQTAPDPKQPHRSEGSYSTQMEDQPSMPLPPPADKQ